MRSANIASADTGSAMVQRLPAAVFAWSMRQP
jgi:hypothetical protein